MLLVILDHGTRVSLDTDGPFALWSPAGHGVRLFFVLSGFLITGILAHARSQAEAAGISRAEVWKAFLVRRALRIFPLAYVAIVVAWLLGFPAAREHLWQYVFYTSNFGVGLFNHESGGLKHFWSLAVEEQFYLLWPLAILWVPRRHWPRLIIAVLIAALATRVPTTVFLGVWGAYSLPWSRFDALAIGALLAVAPPRAAVLAVLAVPFLIIGTLGGAKSMQGVVFNETALVLLTAIVVQYVAQRQPRWLTVRPLVFVGTISYGLYVWNSMVPRLLAALEIHPPDHGMVRLGIVFAGALVLATLTWFVFEKPLNGFKDRWPYLPRPRTAPTAEPVLVGAST